MAENVTLPSGFVLDAPAGLPQGFVLDQQDQPQAQAAPEGAAMAAEMAPQTDSGDMSSAADVAASLYNEILAAQQGTSAAVRDFSGKRLYELAPEDAQVDFFNTGKTDPKKYVALYDPGTQRVELFKRSPKMDEGVLMRLGRLIGLGALTQPVSKIPGGAAAATAQTGKAARLADFERAGVDPSLAAVTGGRTAKQMQNVLHETPIAGGVVERGAQRTVQQIQGSAEDIAAKYGTGASRIDAGQAVRRGAQRFVDSGLKVGQSLTEENAVKLPTRKVGFEQKAEALFNRVAKPFAPDETVSASNTIEALKGPAGRFPNAPDLGKSLTNPKFQQFLGNIESAGGQLSFGELKELRSFVGRQISNPAIVSDIPRGDWKALYGAITEDMKAAAAAKGPEALKAFERANAYYSKGLDRIDGALSKILKADTSEENIFESLVSSASGKLKSASSQRLEQIRRSVSPEEWGSVASTLIRRMGKVSDDAEFSVSRFATSYRNLSPQAKATLFDRAGNMELRSALDSLFRVADYTREVEKLANTSGTGRNIIGAVLTAMGFGGVFAPKVAGAAAVSVMGATAAAKLMFSPSFVRLIVKGPRFVQPGAGTQAYLARLNAFASANPELAPAVRDLTARLQPAFTRDNQQESTGQ